jgi:Na+/proline symporter
MLGALAVCYTLVFHVPGNWHSIIQFGESTGRWQLFDFDPALNKTTITFWSGLIGGAFLALATHGADHMMVQRYLCARNQRSASMALALSGFVVLLQFAFFLFLGVALAWFFSQNPPATPIEKGDQALVTYVVNHTGTGLRGLVLAAVFSASMSSSLNSVTSSLMNDWFERRLATMSDRQSLSMARILTVVFAVVQAAVAIAAYELQLTTSTINDVLGIAGFSTGLILGLFFLALIAPHITEKTAFVAFAAGTAVTCWVAFGTSLHWLWYTLVGSGTIVVTGVVLTMLLDRRGTPEEPQLRTKS